MIVTHMASYSFAEVFLHMVSVSHGDIRMFNKLYSAMDTAESDSSESSSAVLLTPQSPAQWCY